MLKQLGLICLLTLTLSLRNQTPSALPLPLPNIQTLTFLDTQLFYTSPSGFGYLNKKTGQPGETFIYEGVQKYIGQYDNGVVFSNGTLLDFYSTYSREIIMTHPVGATVREYQGFVRGKMGGFVLADGNVYWQNLERERGGVDRIGDSATGEVAKGIYKFGDFVLVYSEKNNSVCLSLMMGGNKTCENCLAISPVSPQKITPQFPKIYIHSGNNLQILNKSLLIISTISLISYTPLQYFQGNVNFKNWKYYNSDSNNIQDGKIVAQNMRYGSNIFIQNNGEFLLKDGHQVLGKIYGVQGEPRAIWLNKSQASVNMVRGKYQLLLQFMDASIKFYEIMVGSGESSTVNLLWSR